MPMPGPKGPGLPVPLVPAAGRRAGPFGPAYQLVLGEHGAEVEPRADIRDVNHERDQAGGFDAYLQQLDEIGIGVDDGDDREPAHDTSGGLSVQELCRSAAKSSPTVLPVTGSIQSGAISASGPSTNRRSRN